MHICGEQSCDVHNTSELLKGQILVESQHGLPPEQDERRLAQLLDPGVDQADSVPKGTDKVKDSDGYLRLRSLLPRGVLVRHLVVAEESLTDGGLVTVLA